MKIPIFQVDAFTDKQFKGNPAAVCPLEEWLPESVMQNIAMENNLAETAFIVKKGDSYQIKWFTPESEIDLCGHATLAAAYVINKYIDNKKEKIEFQSVSGKLIVSRTGDVFSMLFPSRPAKAADLSNLFLKALGKQPIEVYKARDYLLVYKSEDDIKNIYPDMELLKKIDAFAVIVTAPGDEVDFVSRFFAPGAGISEDPVTGSAHCTLIPYWADRLNKKELKARQLSRRGGNLICKLHNQNKVLIAGKAVSYLEGYIYV